MITMENAGEGQGGNSSARQDKRKGQAPQEKAPEKDPRVFSAEGLPQDSHVPARSVSSGSVPGLARSGTSRDLTITTSEKLAFIDSVVNNTRFELNYSLFGGKITLTVRSLTSEEVQALAAWSVKKGTEDPSGQMAGRYRKYLLSAQVARFNGTDLPPMEKPLFETLEKDGKTLTKPGWVDRCSFWDEKASGVISAVMGCLENFDLKYSTLCSKAEDENFWKPDTP